MLKVYLSNIQPIPPIKYLKNPLRASRIVGVQIVDISRQGDSEKIVSLP